MKLARVRLRNFRCYRDEFSLDIGDLTALVGKNDAGKSSILDALQIFFDDTAPDADDANRGGDKVDVRIACEFEDLPKSLVIDAEHETTLTKEYLLNEEGRLEIHKVFNCSLKTPKLSGIFAVAYHPNAAGVSDLLMLKNADLKKRAAERSVDTSTVDNKINSDLRQAIWQSTTDLSLTQREIPLDAEGTRKIWEQLKTYLPTYALFKSDRPSTDQDDEAQDPMKIAVKEALKSKEAELQVISDFVRREVKAIADSTVAKIREMDPELAGQLIPHFGPTKWDSIFKISLTGDEDIPVNKRGSGVRRLILLNFFRAKAEQRANSEGGNLIYAIEEPETSQHPNNQRMLMQALAEISEQPNCQVILTTHTPMLGRLLPVHSLRYIEMCDASRRICYCGDDTTNQLVAKALGVLADNDVRLFVGVEGIHDINFLKGIAKVLRNSGEDVLDLEGLEYSGVVVFFPVGGSNLALWTSRLSKLNRPEFHLYDRDIAPPKESPHQAIANEINKRAGCKAVLTVKREMECYLHPDAIKAVRSEVEIQFGDFDDVPALAAQAIHRASASPHDWSVLSEDKREKKMSQAKKWLNADAVSAMTVKMLDERDPAGDVRSWFSYIRLLMEN